MAMSTDLDDELLNDFVNESRDLVASLDEDLVRLEGDGRNSELLNKIFRGFHTIKGSAGFFALEPVVDLCHACEDVFNQLRAGRLALQPELMDAILAGLDRLRTMMETLAAGGQPPPAEPELIATIREFARSAEAEPPPPEPEPEPAQKPTSAIAAASADPFSDDEFEALLDQLHGQGSAPGAAAAEPEPAAPAPRAPEVAPPPKAVAEPAKPASEPAETTLRIETERLDQVMNLVGELVLVRNRIKTLPAGADAGAFRKTAAELDVITSSLQNAVMKMRMQPIKKLFSRFPRLVREASRKLGKDIELCMHGEEVELDKSLVEALNDPLVHMIRNAVDHGVEDGPLRRTRGKHERGRIELSAEQMGDHILITVADDGGGIDPEKLRRKAIEKGLIDTAQAARMSQDESLQLIFSPGLSTKEQVSDLSGRGVGMDVVRANIAGLNGTVQIDSSIGRGTTFSIRVPLTLAIQPVIMVETAGRYFALPLQPVQDVFMLDETRVRKLDRWEAVLYREEPLRLLRLRRWAGAAEPSDGEASRVVVARVGRSHFGLVVDQVRAREEIVVKPLGRLLRTLAGVGGATVTGEGRVALLLDLGGLVEAYERGL